MAKRFRFPILDFLLLSTFGLTILFFRSIDYGVHQLYGQCHIIIASRPVDVVLHDPMIPDSIKAKLRYIQAIEKFGVQTLGLKPTSNYQTYYDQQGKPVLWVVTASEPYRLVPYTWYFPFLGAVSYKGFFEPERAKALAEDLGTEGWDVYPYDVEAWSTLGWFSDPILSGMLDRDEGRLAELVLHELTHATVYISGQVDVNENLASFIGEQGALAYLKSTFGDTSKVFLNYRQKLNRDERITQHMVRGAQRLSALYASETFQASSQRDALKQQCLDSIVTTIDTLGDPILSNRWRKRKWNNAHFLSYLRYDARKDSLGKVVQREFDGKLNLAIAHWKNTLN